MQRACAYSGQSRLQFPLNRSLNLAQVVQVLAYELRMAFQGPASELTLVESSVQHASSDEIEGMYAHLQDVLVALDFLDPGNPKKLMSRVRHMFARTALARSKKD